MENVEDFIGFISQMQEEFQYQLQEITNPLPPIGLLVGGSPFDIEYVIAHCDRHHGKINIEDLIKIYEDYKRHGVLNISQEIIYNSYLYFKGMHGIIKSVDRYYKKLNDGKKCKSEYVLIKSKIRCMNTNFIRMLHADLGMLCVREREIMFNLMIAYNSISLNIYNKEREIDGPRKVMVSH